MHRDVDSIEFRIQQKEEKLGLDPPKISLPRTTMSDLKKRQEDLRIRLQKIGEAIEKRNRILAEKQHEVLVSDK